MADKTGIEWTEATWNPLVGCKAVSPGCDHCYAARQASGRLAHTPAYAGLARNGVFTGEVRLLPDRLSQPLRWRRPRQIFVNSMSDLFHDGVPDEFIAEVFAVMAEAPQHTFQVLTKRHGRMRSLLSGSGFYEMVTGRLDLMMSDGPPFAYPEWPLRNVWLGVSVENQQWADIRIPALMETPAAVRWISAEPLLGPVDVSSWTTWRDGSLRYSEPDAGIAGLNWVVAGGESGPGARPMHPAWVRSLRDQCVEAEVPFLLKQWGEYAPAAVYDHPGFAGGGRAFNHPRGGTAAAIIREGHRSSKVRAMQPGDATSGGLVMLDRDTVAVRVGKHAAGRELDGRLWDEYPAVVDHA